MEYVVALLIGWGINSCLSRIMHHQLFVSTVNNRNKVDLNRQKFFEQNKALLGVVIFFLSYDYYIADLYKKQIKKLKINKRANLKEYIIKVNKMNFFISILILVTILNSLIQINYVWERILFAFVSIRTISRSVEISIAFYRDISNNKKKSNLLPEERIALGIWSYFEIILNFSVVYFLLENNCSATNSETISILQFLNSFNISLGISTFTNVKFVNLYNTSNICKYAKNVFVMIQLFSSMCLVYFALAKYIGYGKKGRAKNTANSAKNKT